jgi:biopolymer transport protein ExbB/TolQ
MILSTISSKLGLIQWVIIIMLLGTGVAYWYYSQNKIAQLTTQNAALTGAVNSQHQTIHQLQQHAGRTATMMEQLQTDLSQAERGRRDLEVRLRRLNLQVMARTDAVDLERRINSATQQVFRDLEQMTGGAPAVPTSQATPRTTTPATTTVPAPQARPPMRSTTP